MSMAKSKITLKDLMKEIKFIKKIALKDLQIDTEDIKYDKKRLPLIKRSIKESKRIFSDISDWKMGIWDECRFKTAVSKKTAFSYDCKLLKKQCKFEYCPLNIKKKDKK